MAKNESFITKKVKVADLHLNSGQVEGLPKNPRFIKDEMFAKLVQSLRDAPEMLEARPIVCYDNNGELVVIMGNMRLRALREIGEKETTVKVLPAGTAVEKLREYTIKDNIAYGANDWDILANEWDTEELEAWGMEMPFFDDSALNGEGGDGKPDKEDLQNPYSQNIKAPIYEITGENPPIESLIDTTSLDRILANIEKSKVDEAHKKMLRIAAYRHAVIDFSKMAEFYAHADKEVQELMEDNALVIIDFDKAIEKGYVQLTKKLQSIYDQNPIDPNDVVYDDDTEEAPL